MLAIWVAEGASPEVPDRGNALISVMWPLTALAFLTAVLRILVRARNKALGYNDFFMIVATVCPT